MTRSISELLDYAKSVSGPVQKHTDEPAPWRQVCVCGHPARKHSVSVGGTMVPRDDLRLKRFVFDGCRGPTRSRNADDQDMEIPRDQSDDGRAVMRLRPTCPCTEFRPVLEGRDLKFRFSIKLPTTTPRSGVRDRNPMRHPLMTGIRGTETAARKKVIPGYDPKNPPAEIEPEILMEIREWVDNHLRFMDTWKCMKGGCTETEGVFPYYVDDTDRSELRCVAHRPPGLPIE